MAQKIIAEDATDYASYHTSTLAKANVSTQAYKDAFKAKFMEWITQYMPGTTMNILNSNVFGTTNAKYTDGNSNSCL